MKTANVFPDSDIKGLHAELSRLWSAETSSDANWSRTNLELGQCLPTALVVQDIFGGTILQATVNGVVHCWNLLPDGAEADLTRAQFETSVIFDEVDENFREQILLEPAVAERYFTLAERLNEVTAAQAKKVKQKLKWTCSK